MPVVKERRCNLFDDDGRPRRLRDGTKGCQRDASACHFAHPHEREWKAAHPSYPPKPELVADSDSGFYYMLVHPDRAKDHRNREKDRDRERERARERERERKRSLSFLGSPPHRKDSTTTRGSTVDTPMDSSVPTKRGRSPALSSSSDQLERLRKDNRPRIHDLPPSRRDYFPPMSPSRDRDKEQVSLPGQTPLARSHVPDTATPPEPPMPPPLQPAPPPPQLSAVPELPSFASGQKTAPGTVKEVSMDEQRQAWHNRIDLIFASVTSRRDFAKLESELSQLQSLSNTSIVNNMPDANRARINAQKMSLELEIEVKRKEVNDTVQKLVASNFWPILRTPQIAEMEKALDDTKKHVVEVRGLLGDVKSSCAALFKTSASDWTQDSDRPPKRRRLEEDVDTPGSGVSNRGLATTEDATWEFEAFRDKLTELDHHLVDLENDIIQRDTIISDEIELQIDARLEEETALYPPVREPGEISPTEIEAVVNSKNQELVRAVAVTGEEIGELAVEVAELITKVNALEDKCRTLEVENQEFKSKLAQDTMRHAQSQDALVRRDKEIDAIAAALQAYITQAPAGQAAGDLPSAEYIMESLSSQLDGLLREKFCATMVNIQQEVFDRVQESHSRTLDTVSPKIMLLLKMVNLITARLGKPDMDTVNAG